MSENHATAGEMPHRVVEWELKRPEVHLPEVDLEPGRRIAEDVLLTGIGMAVLGGRALAKAIRAANAAGAEAAEHPGPVTKALLRLVRPETKEPTGGPEVIAMLPLADYDSLAVDELLARLPELLPHEIETLLAYERNHQNRAAVVAAMTERLA